MITNQAYEDYHIWEHSKSVYDLYLKRCLKEVEEMTCHKQAMEVLAPYFDQGDSLLDVGCGSGYFFHSVQQVNLSVNYHGIDASRTLIELGQKIMPQFGLPKGNLRHQRIEDTDGCFDHVVCINVLSNIDNYHKPLERMLKMAKKSVLIRESMSDHCEYSYVKDNYLDSNVDLKVYVNTYSVSSVMKFMQSYGYKTMSIEDEYTQGKPEDVIGYLHYWRYILAVRED